MSLYWPLIARQYWPLLAYTGLSPVRPLISIPVATLMGTRLLKEGDALHRSVAAVAMMAGVVALALG